MNQKMQDRDPKKSGFFCKFSLHVAQSGPNFRIFHRFLKFPVAHEAEDILFLNRAFEFRILHQELNPGILEKFLKVLVLGKLQNVIEVIK